MKDPLRSMCKDRKSLGLLLTRIVIAIIFLYHGVPKALDWTMASGKFAAMGFPGFLGPLVGIIEVVAAVLILLGLWHMEANYVLAVIILVAIIGVQLKKAAVDGSLTLTAGLERDLLILVGNLTLAWFGPGKYAMRK